MSGPEPLISRPTRNLLLVMSATGAVMAGGLYIGFQLDRHAQVQRESTGGPVLGPDGIPRPVYQPPAPTPGLGELIAQPLRAHQPVFIWVFAALLAVPLGLWLRRWLKDARSRAARRRHRIENERKRAERVAELEADPERRAYARRVAAGESWSNDQIDYDRDPDALATCEHLRPIERALRRAQLPVRFVGWSQGVVSAACRIDAPALERAGLLAPPAQYQEFYQTDRPGEEYPIAALTCLEHRQVAIRLLHPDDGGPKVPVFRG